MVRAPELLNHRSAIGDQHHGAEREQHPEAVEPEAAPTGAHDDDYAEGDDRRERQCEAHTTSVARTSTPAHDARVEVAPISRPAA